MLCVNSNSSLRHEELEYVVVRDNVISNFHHFLPALLELLL